MTRTGSALAGLALVAALACFGGAAAQKYEPNGDIWKYRVPKRPVPAEFDGEDVMGVIAGRHIRTDCSVNVIKSGKIYCFTAAASQTFFKYAPNTNIAKAQDAWERLKSKDSSGAATQ